MNFGLDYLSAHLDKASYDLWAFEREAASPVFNRETGEINNVAIPKKTYRKDVHLMDVVIGTYSGGQFGFAPIVIREGLKVTRVDLKCDIYDWTGSNEGRTANDYGIYIARTLKNYFASKGRRVHYLKGEDTAKGGIKFYSHTFGARGSEWQLRIYTKGQGDGQLVRFEFQLRKELARSVWEVISPNIYDQQLLKSAFSAIESEVLEFGLLQIPYERSDILVSRSPETTNANRERWVRTQVLSACLAEFKESGINLPEMLLADFNKHFATIRELNIGNDALNKRLKAERLFTED